MVYLIKKNYKLILNHICSSHNNDVILEVEPCIHMDNPNSPSTDILWE